MNRKEREILARQIASLEKRARDNDEEAKDKLMKISDNLTFEDLLAIDNYILKNKLLDLL